jgi:hypothetical protein
MRFAILEVAQGSKSPLFLMRPGNADVLVGSLGPGSRRGRQRSQGGSCPGFDKFFKVNIHLRETNEAEYSLWVEGDRNVPAPLVGTPVQRHIRLHSSLVNQIFEMRPLPCG